MFKYIVPLLLLSNTVYAAQCIKDNEIKENIVLLEDSMGTGLGTGVLYQDNVILTTYSNTKKAKELRAYIPAYDHVKTDIKVLFSSPKPDIAVIGIATPVSDTKPLTLARKVLRGEHMKFASFPFSNRKRLGTANSKMNTFARFTHDTRLLYFNATLDDWAFYGDNGGSFFNCSGELIGLHFGPLHSGGKPDFIYGLNMRAIEDALKASNIPVRRQY